MEANGGGLGLVLIAKTPPRLVLVTRAARIDGGWPVQICSCVEAGDEIWWRRWWLATPVSGFSGSGRFPA